MARGLVVVVAGLVACGRVGYDAQVAPDGPPADAAPDAATDASALCPAGTTELSTGSAICIEQVERGYLPWADAAAACASAGRRLCRDAEWAEACAGASGLVDMVNDQAGAAPEWEWVAEMDQGTAWKRGYAECASTSTHPVTDSYDFRCCYDKP